LRKKRRKGTFLGGRTVLLGKRRHRKKATAARPTFEKRSPSSSKRGGKGDEWERRLAGKEERFPFLRGQRPFSKKCRGPGDRRRPILSQKKGVVDQRLKRMYLWQKANRVSHFSRRSAREQVTTGRKVRRELIFGSSFAKKGQEKLGSSHHVGGKGEHYQEGAGHQNVFRQGEWGGGRERGKSICAATGNG